MSELLDMIAEIELSVLAGDEWVRRAMKGEIKRPAEAIERMRSRVIVRRKLLAFLRSQKELAL